MMAPVQQPPDPSPAPAARGWAVPGSSEDQPTPEAGAARPGGPAFDSAVPGVAEATGGAIDATPAAVPRVALRPMTVADVLDGGFAVLKARPRRILAITAAFLVPTYLLSAWLQRDATGGISFAEWFAGDVATVDDTPDNPWLDLVVPLVVSLLPSIALVCVAAAVAHLVMQWAMGRDAPWREMVGVIGGRWWALLGSFVLVKLAEIAGCYIGTLFIMALFVPVAPIVGVEKVGAVEACRRSVRLTRARYGPTLGLAVLMGIVATLLGAALSALPQSLALWIGFEQGWPLVALGSIAAEIVVLPFVAAATTLLYLDLRVRTEGLDLEMSAIELLDRAA